MILGIIGWPQVVLIFVIFATVLWIYGWAHLLKRAYSQNTKIIFGVLFILLGIVGTVLYFIVRDRKLQNKWI